MATMIDILVEMEHAEQPRREQRLHSVWEVTCMCGREFSTRETETVCPHCGRSIRIEWGSPLRRPAPAA